MKVKFEAIDIIEQTHKKGWYKDDIGHIYFIDAEQDTQFVFNTDGTDPWIEAYDKDDSLDLIQHGKLTLEW